MPELSIVITIYNAEQSIPELLDRLQHSVPEVSEDYELIFVEDHGRDRSWDLLKTAARQDKRIKVIRMARNFGQHNAITAGLQMSTGNYVVLMDGDLQDEPEVIPKLYQQIKQTEKEIIYVKRINRKDTAFKRQTSKLFYKGFSLLSGMKISPEIGTFRIMTKLVSDSFCQFREINKFIGGIFNWMDFEEGVYEAEHKDRKHGKSNYRIKTLLKLAFNGIFSFSNKPLSIAMYIGLFSSIISLFFGLYFIYIKLFYKVTIVGYYSIIVSLYFIGGLILFTLGIIGEYIGRIYDQSRSRPEYLIKEKINF